MAKQLLGSLELNRIYQRDCLEGMRLIMDDSVDLIVIDPPYNIGKDKRWDKWKTVDEYVEFMSEVFTECERVLKPNGSFYFFHNDMMQIRKLMSAVDETSFEFKQFIVWNKRFDGARNKGFLDGFIEPEGLRNYQQMTEYLLYYVKPSGVEYGDTGWERVRLDVTNFKKLRDYFCELHKSTGLTKKKLIELVGQRVDHCLRYKSSQWGLPTKDTYSELVKYVDVASFETRSFESLTDEFERLRASYVELVDQYEGERYTYNNQRTHHSVWNYEIAQKQGHITPKPVELIENVILHSSNTGDVVLDCFMGSGTTAVASVLTNRNFIGFERESEYIQISNQRLEAVEDEIAERKLTE
jgi:site-specific DNA-methyltransferase (adenine-specific)